LLYVSWKKNTSNSKKKNLRKKFKTNIPQSAKLDYQQTVASFFGDPHFTHVFQQKASSGLTRAQDL
jgi:hypothetical protein